MARRSFSDWARGVMQKSPWFVIAVAIHVVLFALLSVIYVTRHFQTQDETPVAIAVASPPEVAEDAPPPPPEVIDRKAIPENTDAELVSFEEEVFIPTSMALNEDVDLHMDRGDPTAVANLPKGPAGATGGTSIGAGGGAGHFGTGMPSAFATRRAGTGVKHGRPGGATVGTEKAVLEGLRWLIRHQAEDGSWPAVTLYERCSTAGAQCVAESVDFTPEYTPGLTALSLLAFLGAGFAHDSKVKVVDTAMGREHIVGDVVKRGLKWLVDEQGPDGAFVNYPGSMYNEALGALALSEAYGLTRNKFWRDPAQKAIDYLVASQKRTPDGTGLWGWRYTPGLDSESDTSVTCWVVMALKSAQIAGLKVPEESMESALQFALWVTGTDGKVGYLVPEAAGDAISGRNEQFDYHAGSMSALGMLVRTFVAHDHEDPFLLQAADYIITDLPAVSEDHLSVDYYYWYYGSLALNQYDGPDSPHKGGKHWDAWNKAVTEAILELQDKNEDHDVCTRGGWLVGDRWAYAGGPIYTTATNVLTLEVYYRYANAFGTK
jgi:hypothetical protein